MKKKKIKLTEIDLQNIIEESVRTILNKTSYTGIFDVNSIDISKIDIDILKQAYIDLRLIPIATFYGDPLSNLSSLKESVGDIMPPDGVVHAIIQKYHLSPQLIFKVEAHHQLCVYAVTACIGINDKIIEDDMEKMGYFLGHRGNIQTVGNMNFQVLQFEPYSYMQNDETQTIQKRFNWLYHWTPEYNLNSILQNGLVPNHQNKKFAYPSRIYLMLGNTNLSTMEDLGKELCKVNTDKRNNGGYVLLRVSLKNLNNVHFYYVSNAEIGLYTEDKIPASNITVVGNFQF